MTLLTLMVSSCDLGKNKYKKDGQHLKRIIEFIENTEDKKIIFSKSNQNEHGSQSTSVVIEIIEEKVFVIFTDIISYNGNGIIRELNVEISSEEENEHFFEYKYESISRVSPMTLEFKGPLRVYGNNKMRTTIYEGDFDYSPKRGEYISLEISNQFDREIRRIESTYYILFKEVWNNSFPKNVSQFEDLYVRSGIYLK